jgi:hypothetical protein
MNWKPATSKIAIEKSADSKTNKTFILALPQNHMFDESAFFQFLFKFQVDTPQQPVACREEQVKTQGLNRLSSG